jgi:type I restriction enzyme S subunit
MCLARGIRERSTDFRFQTFGAQTVPLPTVEEQRAIADYLDANAVKVRRFIRNRRRLIEVLNEQKHAIINQAVTLGLDSAVPRKPSGIDWLGEVPEHWNILPFTKYAIERADYRGATPEKVDSGIFLVTAKNIRKGWIDYEVSKEFVRTENFSVIMRRGLPQCDDLLLTMEAPLGHIALVDREDIALAQRLVRFRMNTDHFMPKFVLHSALSAYFQNQMLCRGTGSTAM